MNRTLLRRSFKGFTGFISDKPQKEGNPLNVVKNSLRLIDNKKKILNLQ